MLNKKIASEVSIGIISLLAIVVGGIFYWQNQKISEVDNKQPEQKACTMEAKLCDDGSYVGRTGPNCEFAPCPVASKQDIADSKQQMANPASVYCEQNGGKLEIRTAFDGGQTGYCKFSDGSECEEWAYFRKECETEKLDANQIKSQSINQWQQCKSKTITADTILSWNIKISDTNSFGGYYAKGFLNSNPVYPVHVIVKLDVQNLDQIKQRIIPGEIVALKGQCTGIETDGSIIFEVF
ncbi:MAG TPA: DUF333 domain-containing protein [Candidatus Moranbacteria bacterium]|nr:DUF333 domain-containing protein [Candidatus Moranbacteria bacterium]HRZ33761.1 DUF333 domain-containing protein [Candidatus Moranbacteria bacterium]